MQLAKRLELPLVRHPGDLSSVWLIYQEGVLKLRARTSPPTGPVGVDFLSGKSRHRRLFGNHKGQLLAQAIGYKKVGLKVFDATLGLGQDAFAMACLGCQVLGMEQSAVLLALVEDAWARAKDQLNPEGGFKGNLKFLKGNSLEYLTQMAGKEKQTERPEVVYLDPMFRDLKKKALPPKEMQVLQVVLATQKQNEQSQEEGDLLEQAKSVALRRIVVKRPLRAPALAGQTPHHSLKGKSIRYDIYLPSNASERKLIYSTGEGFGSASR